MNTLNGDLFEVKTNWVIENLSTAKNRMPASTHGADDGHDVYLGPGYGNYNQSSNRIYDKPHLHRNSHVGSGGSTRDGVGQQRP